MRLSTSTNICAFTPGRERLPVEFSIDTCARAGYRVLDINWCMAMNPDSPLRGEDWARYVSHIGEYAAARGITFSQSHLPYYPVFSEKTPPETAALMEKLIDRCIAASATLKVPWAVTHPCPIEGAGAEETIKRNLAYYAPHMENARKAGVGIALENDFGLDHAGKPIFGASMDELCALIDAFHDPFVGACCDFGHANLCGGDHRANLNKLGARLKATHVQDNHGAADEHLMPFYGNIDWRSAMAGLNDIAYQGDLTYEIQEFGRYLPKDMKHLVVEQSLVIGERLLAWAHS